MFDQSQLHAVEQNTPRPTTPPAGPAPRPVVSAPASTASTLPASSPANPGENADIYYMPENFQKNNQVAGRNTSIPGIWVLAIVILILILIGGGLYIFWTQPAFLSKLLGNQPAAPVQPVVETPDSGQNTPLQPAASTRPAGSPKETYVVFRSELALADTVESYLAAYSKYATSARYAELLEQKSKAESAGASGTSLLSALQSEPFPVLDGTEDIIEDITDQRATLTVTKTSKRSVGTIVFLPEKGQWKLSQELWEDSGEPVAPTNTPRTPDDNDKDGLGNEEEAVLGTDPQKADSDSDGYDDLAEITNGYNPAGAGKLSDNKNLATYLNTTFNLSLLYPAAWNKTIATGDDSIIFTAPDGQFIQMLVQPNTDREDIATWYRKTFNSEAIPVEQILVSTDWDGIRKTDGLVAYLTDKNKAYIFTAAYNLGSSSVSKYKNIFDLMLKSLKIAS